MALSSEITTTAGELYRIADASEFGLLAQTPHQLGSAAAVVFCIGMPGEIMWLPGVRSATDAVVRIVHRIGPRWHDVFGLDELVLPARALPAGR